MAKKCIDISNWQGPVKQGVFVSNKGKIPCVILRISVTLFRDKLTIEKDKSFEADIKAAHAAGMAIGGYFYSQAKTEAEITKEVEFCLAIAQKYKSYFTLPIAVDYEFGSRLTANYSGELGKQRVKNMIDLACTKIRAAGFQPMLYANLSTLNGYIASDVYKNWPIWVAQYHSRCDYKHPIYMWQYSSSGKVSGIPGRIDMNWLYGQEIAATPTNAEKYPYELPKLPKRGWFTSGDGGKGSSVSKEEVKKLQRFLNWYGDYGLKIDGEVGRLTMNAVLMFQGREKLTKDKLFGPECLARAKEVRR